MFVADCQLDAEGFTRGHENLENEELVDYVQTVGHGGSLRTRVARVMKVCAELLRVGGELYALVLETEDVALDFAVELFGHFRHALVHRERLVRLGTCRQLN